MKRSKEENLEGLVRLVVFEMNAALAAKPVPDLQFECVALYDMVSRWRAELRYAVGSSRQRSKEVQQEIAFGLDGMPT